MIYLIETTYYNKDTKEVLDLLKIGYTKDINSRIDSYYLHNPECRLLDTFRLKRPEEFKRLNIKLYNKSVKLGFNSKNLKYISYPNRYNTVKDFQDLINN